MNKRETVIDFLTKAKAIGISGVTSREVADTLFGGEISTTCVLMGSLVRAGIAMVASEEKYNQKKYAISDAYLQSVEEEQERKNKLKSLCDTTTATTKK